MNTVYLGEDMEEGIFRKSSKINYVEMSHNDYEAMQQLSDPTITTPTDSLLMQIVQAFTFDEIGLLAGVTNSGVLTRLRPDVNTRDYPCYYQQIEQLYRLHNNYTTNITDLGEKMAQGSPFCY